MKPGRVKFVGLYACLGVGCLMALAGCVERTISISSEPSGALVYLNDEEVGRTPVTVPFTYYGKYDVRLQKQGYSPLWTSGDAEAPWWEFPGPDLIGELMGNKVKIDWKYTLEPRDENNPDIVLKNAQEMRERTVGKAGGKKLKLKKAQEAVGAAMTQPAGDTQPSGN
jgi:hypothetical protein